MNINIDGISLSFITSSDVFSPKGADAGTLAMLTAARPFLLPDALVMDMGCGYGFVGIYAAKVCGVCDVVMSDVSAEAVRLSIINCELNGLDSKPVVVESDCFKSIDRAGFDVILNNPPYHADFSLPKEIIEKGFNRLKIGGRLIMVTKRLDWYKKKISSVFGGVRVSEIDGYYVFIAERRQMKRSDRGMK